MTHEPLGQTHIHTHSFEHATHISQNAHTHTPQNTHMHTWVSTPRVAKVLCFRSEQLAFSYLSFSEFIDHCTRNEKDVLCIQCHKKNVRANETAKRRAASEQTGASEPNHQRLSFSPRYEVCRPTYFVTWTGCCEPLRPYASWVSQRVRRTLYILKSPFQCKM